MNEHPAQLPIPDLTATPRINPHFRLQWEPAQQSFVLLYPEGMVKLNQSAGEILSRCDGTATLSAVIAGLTQKFPDAPTLETDVLEFVADAQERDWLRL